MDLVDKKIIMRESEKGREREGEGGGRENITSIIPSKMSTKCPSQSITLKLFSRTVKKFDYI